MTVRLTDPTTLPRLVPRARLNGAPHAWTPAEGHAGRDGLCARCDVHQEEHAPLSGPLAPNAAETWAVTLPSASDLAIHAARVERTRRSLARSWDVLPTLGSEALTARLARNDERREVESVTRSAPWAWALASLACMAILVALCAWSVR